MSVVSARFSLGLELGITLHVVKGVRRRAEHVPQPLVILVSDARQSRGRSAASHAEDSVK